MTHQSTPIARSFALLVALASSAAFAEEQLERRPIGGGMICDKLDEVLAYIDSYGQYLPAGCGSLNKPMWADIYLLQVYPNAEAEFLLARYEFPMRQPDGSIEIWTQYGYWGSPRPIPAAFEQDT